MMVLLEDALQAWYDRYPPAAQHARLPSLDLEETNIEVNALDDLGRGTDSANEDFGERLSLL